MIMSLRVQKAYKYLVLEVLFLIAFGGAVRAMNAGLACPDWPLCFGDYIPDYHPQVYFEFIHRVLAGVVAIAVLVLNTAILRSNETKKSIKVLVWVSFILLVAQIIMGGLTVLLQLDAKVVTIHLALGTGLFASLLWIYMGISPQRQVIRQTQPSLPLRWGSFVLLAIVYTQLLLGGLVASHYAALVCVDFPLCHGKLIPTLSGVLGLQVIHRLGAYVTLVAALVFLVVVRRSAVSMAAKKWSNIPFALVLVQVGLGIANVLFKTPPLLTVLHLAVGTMILGAMVRVVYIFTTNCEPMLTQLSRAEKPVRPSEKHRAKDSSLQPG